MSNNIILFYKKNRDVFDQMLSENLVNPKSLLQQNDQGETVLHHLINSHDNKCAQNVLNFVKKNFSATERQRFIDAQNKDGDTAIHLAIKNNDFETATLLDIFGANKRIPNARNEIIENTDSSEFVDSEQEIKCGETKKMDALISGIIKPSKSYKSEEANDSDLPDSLDDILLTEKPKSKSKLANSESPDNLDDIVLTEKPKSKSKPKGFIQNFFSNIFGTKSPKQSGGSVDQELSDSTQSTSEFLKYISEKISQTGGQADHESSSSFDSSFDSTSSSEHFKYTMQLGGRSKKSKKSKKAKKSKKSKMSRTATQSEDIHAEVIKMIQDLGYSLDEAKTIKAALYSYTKQQHPELSNYERAVKMRSYTTQQHIANLDIESVKQALAAHYATKPVKPVKPTQPEEKY